MFLRETRFHAKMTRAEDTLSANRDRYSRAIAAFDALNAEDPNREMVEGAEQPKEFVYARRMTERLQRFAPEASEPLRLAARCQHIQRWMIPRSDYPMDRGGYRRWRIDLAQFHAELAGEVLAEVGYDPETISRVQRLLRKEGLKRDADVQTLEDVACLVFLGNYFADFASKHDEEKVVGILRKTLRKMSDRGRQEALSMPMQPASRAILDRAIAQQNTI